MDTIKNNSTADREILITRTVNAPRELVWDAMTRPEHVVHWWGPTGFTTTIAEMDVRVGGVWKHMMHGPDGTDYPNSSVFLEVNKPGRIVYEHGGSKHGGAGPHFTATWTFEAQGEKTKVTIHMIFDNVVEREHVVNKFGAIEGGKQTLNRLDTYAQGMANNATGQHAIKITVATIVAAPIEEVWRAYTTPADIKQWNAASDDWHTTAATVDLRVGGTFSSRMEAKDGSMGFDFSGTYTSIVKHKLIAYSFGERTAHVEFTSNPQSVSVHVTFDSEPTHSIEQQRNGWQAILNNFTRHVEAGIC